MEGRERAAPLGIPAVTELGRTCGAEPQSMETLAIFRSFTTRSRTTLAQPMVRTGHGAMHPPTLAAGASVSSLCPLLAATLPLDPFAISLAQTGVKNITSALKKGRTGLGATRTRSKRNGATALWKWREGRAKRVIHASHAAAEASTPSPGVGLMTRTRGGGSAYSMLFTEVPGSSHLKTKIIKAAIVSEPLRV